MMKKKVAGGKRRLSLRALAAVVLALGVVGTTLLLLRGPPAAPPGHALDQLHTHLRPLKSQNPELRGSEWKPEFSAGGSARVPLFGTVSSAQFFQLFGTVALGTPPQNFKVTFETSEDVVWLPNTRSTTSSHAVYDHSKSRSYEADGTGATSFGAYYAFLGFVSRDTVHVGDFALPNVSFVEVTRVQSPPDFDDDAAVDGMFGLSPDLDRNAVLQRLVRSGALDEPVFAFYFAKRQEATKIGAAAATAASVGELSLGAIDRTRYTGEIHYVPTIDEKSWRVELDAVTVGGTSENFATTEMTAPAMRNGRAVVPAEVSPSWPVILGPAEDIKRLAKAVGAKNGQIDCSSRGPDIVFHIGSVLYTLTKDDYTLRESSGGDAESCRWAFIGLDLGYWWLGQPFLHKFYSVFELGSGGGDGGGPRVGFALAA